MTTILSPHLISLTKQNFKQMILSHWNIQEVTGYEPQTTFWMDFSIADKYGLVAIQDTFDRSFREWKSNYIYVTELTLVVNHKCWFWYNKDNEKSKLYADLYYKIDDWCLNNLKGKELEYYISTTD